MLTIDEVNQVYKEADCLHDLDAVNNALDKMAAAITKKLGSNNPLVISVMSGAMIPAGHLLTRLNFPLEIDYIHATRYANQTRGGEISWLVEPRAELKGRDILVVDDILDEGITLAEILKYCKDKQANAVYSAVLVDKIHNRKNDLVADFVGVETEDRYLFGFGMDYKGYLRNAPGIYAVKGM